MALYSLESIAQRLAMQGAIVGSCGSLENPTYIAHFEGALEERLSIDQVQQMAVNIFFCWQDEVPVQYQVNPLPHAPSCVQARV